jgi:AraC-like DNA-binding protein
MSQTPAEAQDVRPALRALFEKHYPGKSIRRITRERGVPEHLVTKWFKKTTNTTRIPDLDMLGLLAEVIGCPVSQVFRAFRSDHGYFFDEHTISGRFERLGSQQQDVVVRLAGASAERFALVSLSLALNERDLRLLITLAQTMATTNPCVGADSSGTAERSTGGCDGRVRANQ